MMTLRVLGAVAAIASLTLLSGCSGAADSSLPQGAPLPAGGQAEAPGDTSGGSADKAPEAQPAGVPGASAGQLLARTARVSLTVTDVEVAATRLKELAASLSGQVTAENLVTRTGGEGTQTPTSTIVISVPADRLDSALDQLKSVGTVTSRVISSEDVTLQVADVESRIKTLDDSIGRLRDLWARAGSVRDLTALENEIQARISERDALAAQQEVLARRVAQSPITIVLSTPEAVAQPGATGFLEGLIAGWNALVGSSRLLLMAVGALLPFAAVAAIVAVPLVAWRRRVAARRAPAAAGTAAPTSSAPSGERPDKD